MLKEEFANRIEKNKFDLGDFKVAVNELSHLPNVMGCYEKDGMWNVYTTDEAGIKSLYMDSYNEEDAYKCLYRMVENKAALVKETRQKQAK